MSSTTPTTVVFYSYGRKHALHTSSVIKSIEKSPSNYVLINKQPYNHNTVVKILVVNQSYDYDAHLEFLECLETTENVGVIIDKKRLSTQKYHYLQNNIERLGYKHLEVNTARDAISAETFNEFIQLVKNSNEIRL